MSVHCLSVFFCVIIYLLSYRLLTVSSVHPFTAASSVREQLGGTVTFYLSVDKRRQVREPYIPMITQSEDQTTVNVVACSSSCASLLCRRWCWSHVEVSGLPFLSNRARHWRDSTERCKYWRSFETSLGQQQIIF